MRSAGLSFVGTCLQFRGFVSDRISDTRLATKVFEVYDLSNAVWWWSQTKTEICFIGVTRDLEQIKYEGYCPLWSIERRYMHAPYAFSPCNCVSVGLGTVIHRLNWICLKSGSWFLYSSQVLCKFEGTGSSHCSCAFHRFWISILAKTITGPSSPSGSKSLAVCEKIYRFVFLWRFARFTV